MQLHCKHQTEQKGVSAPLSVSDRRSPLLQPDDGKDGKKKADWAETSVAFWREAEMLASLNHPNVLRVYGVVVVDPPTGVGQLGSSGSPLDRTVVGIMTEYMSGGSLSSFLAQLYK
jgi:serine/threonine protein kinase